MRWLGGRATRARFPLSGALLAITVANSAMATEPDAMSLSRAHDAYARGAAAYALGDYTRAARELAFADALVPDDVTLKAALDAVTLADDPVLGVELIERATRTRNASTPQGLTHSVEVARARFAHRTGRIVVRCEGCLALVDGKQLTVGVPAVVPVGVHQVALQVGPTPESRLVTVAADETQEVAPDGGRGALAPSATDARPPDEDEADRRLSPVWFVAAAAATAGLGIGAVVSGVRTTNDHDRFESAGCATSPGMTCAALAATGQSAQTTTTWLAAGAGAALAGTAALGMFGVRWHRVGRGAVSAHLAGTTAVVDLAF